jgi:glycogenin glucosyltransferase
MWYKVPDTKPSPAAMPKPIFPFEMRADRPPATRVFADEVSPVTSPRQESGPAAPTVAHQFSTTHFAQPEETSSGRGSSPPIAEAFSHNNVNAWDAIPSIGNYVRAIEDLQSRRAKPQVVYSSAESGETLADVRKDRRTSLIITDFPSTIERPSLPVTPAPRLVSAWGKEKDAGSELPAAEGVPDQAEWVCPQCGFQSVCEDDFRHPGREPSHISTPPASHTPVAQSPPEQDTPVVTQPPKDPQTETSTTQSRPAYRSGTSSSGAPLATLTDPSLLTSSPRLPWLSTELSSASAVAPTSTAPSIRAPAT